ncbi:PKD domain-containing protein [Natrinema sp. 1APR25-10V2]|uniref:PKD domain-containing protein n=1 Tax=Natrinema sp. 1APR25-10V2 TaxID=2951081 RepID=UPI002876E57B|nr:PKD domain-containing protein [Natrinema sp. 1APR25-10V2]MDS0475673.1 PKD domain-containing protein [Natrinema sp. 1APR25-10V2]
MFKTTVTVGMVLVLLVAPMIGVVGATSTTASVQTDETAAQEYETGIQNVSIWERSLLPFRANYTDASTAVELHDIFVRGPDGTDVPANRETVGVFDTGSTVPLGFDNVTGANTSRYAGDDVRVIVAEPNSSSIADVFGGAALFTNDLSSLNENTTFRNVSTTTLAGDGTLAAEIPYEPTTTGQHVAMLATIEDGNGLDVENGNLTVDGNATIVGLESFHVQDAASTVEPTDSDLDSDDLGNNVTFEVNTTIDGDSIGHGIVLYDEDAFLDPITRLNLTASPDENLSMENVSLEPGISDLHGVMRLEDNGTVNETLIDTLNATVNESASEGIVLNASMTALVTNESNTSIDVGTREDWDADASYRYVHIAVGEDGDQLQTATGTLSFKDEQKGGGGIGPIGPGPSPPGDDEPDKGDKPMPIITFDPAQPTAGEYVTISGAESTDSKWDIISYEWTINGESYTGETVTTRFDEPGEYTVELTVENKIAVTNTVTETLVVEKGTDPGSGDGTGDGDGTDDTGGTDDPDGKGDGDGGFLPIPGFGTSVALVALLSAALVLARKQD